MSELKTHVTIPRQPNSGVDLMLWCKDVNYAIKQLASRKIVQPSASGIRLSSPGRTGAFCKKYETGDPLLLKLIGGTVTGGIGNEVVADLTLATVGSEPADGTHHYLQVSYTAYTEDGVLLPGGDVTAVSSGSGTSIPDNVIPTVADPDGTLYISLGSWVLGKFEVAGCGNFQIGHCLGTLTYSRA
jgi:hypothetical protein